MINKVLLRFRVICVILSFAMAAVLVANSHGQTKQEAPFQLENCKDISQDFKPNCLIFWTAEWCPSCRKMKPVIAALEKEGYDVYTFNYDENHDLGKKMGVTTLPTSIIREAGEEIARHIGVVKAATIKKTLKKNEDPQYEIF